MKSCPDCNRTFEDTLTYCLVDGSILSAPYDPQATIVMPETDKTALPPTEVLPTNASPLHSTVKSHSAPQHAPAASHLMGVDNAQTNAPSLAKSLLRGAILGGIVGPIIVLIAVWLGGRPDPVGDMGAGLIGVILVPVLMLLWRAVK